MNSMFETIHNHHERAVLDAVIAAASGHERSRAPE
jgi:hypothetical protein